MLPRLGAEACVIALAEHRLAAVRIAALAPAVRRQGWALLASPALAGPGGGLCGGVGFLARSFLDVGAAGICSPDVVPGRVYAVLARIGSVGHVVLYSVYLTPCIGFRGANAEMVGVLLSHAQSHGRPWIAIGDWNAEPTAAQRFFAA